MAKHVSEVDASLVYGKSTDCPTIFNDVDDYETTTMTRMRTRTRTRRTTRPHPIDVPSGEPCHENESHVDANAIIV